MAPEISYAAFSPLYIAGLVIYGLYSLYKASKKKEGKQGKRSPRTPQPGKSIEDILRELERRASGAPEAPPVVQEKEPQLVPNRVNTYEPPKEKTVADYKAEKHSDMEQHHMTEEQLHDGKFDEIDDRLMHLERNEIDAHAPTEHSRYNADDLRQAVILSTILNRPEF